MCSLHFTNIFIVLKQIPHFATFGCKYIFVLYVGGFDVAFDWEDNSCILSWDTSIGQNHNQILSHHVDPMIWWISNIDLIPFESLLILSSNLIFNLLVPWFIQIIGFRDLFYNAWHLCSLFPGIEKSYFIFWAYAKKQNHEIATGNKWCKELLTFLWFHPRMHTNLSHLSAYNFNLATSSSYQETGSSCTLLCFITNCCSCIWSAEEAYIPSNGHWIEWKCMFHTAPGDASIPSSPNSQWKLLHNEWKWNCFCN